MVHISRWQDFAYLPISQGGANLFFQLVNPHSRGIGAEFDCHVIEDQPQLVIWLRGGLRRLRRFRVGQHQRREGRRFSRRLGGGQDQLSLLGQASPRGKLVRLHSVTPGYRVDRFPRLQRLRDGLRLHGLWPPPMPALRNLHPERSEKRSLSLHCETHSHLEMGITPQAPPRRATCGSATAYNYLVRPIVF